MCASAYVVHMGTRNQKLSTTLTEDEKQAVRVRAARQGKNMSQYIRDLIYDDLEESGHETSRQQEAASEGNQSRRNGTAD